MHAVGRFVACVYTPTPPDRLELAMAPWHLFAGTSCATFRMSTRGRVATLNLRLVAWLAAAALLFAALDPTLAQAVSRGADGSAPWAEVCTASGMQPSANPTSGGETPPHHGIKHCPWCAGAGQSGVLPSASFIPQFGRRVQPPPQELRNHPSVRFTSRGASQPRAPPAYS